MEVFPHFLSDSSLAQRGCPLVDMFLPNSKNCFMSASSSRLKNLKAVIMSPIVLLTSSIGRPMTVNLSCSLAPLIQVQFLLPSGPCPAKRDALSSGMICVVYTSEPLFIHIFED